MTLDSLDLEIMKILQRDGRKSFRDIASMLSKPESTIRLRYNQLIENKILRIVAIPDPREVGFGVMAVIGLKMDLRCVRKAAETIAQYEDVRFIAATSGKYDLILELYTKSNDELVRFVTEELSRIEGIKECDLSVELKLYKDTYEWLSEERDKENK